MLNQAKDDMRNIQNRFIKDARNKKDSFSEDLIFNIQENVNHNYLSLSCWLVYVCKENSDLKFKSINFFFFQIKFMVDEHMLDGEKLLKSKEKELLGE